LTAQADASRHAQHRRQRAAAATPLESGKESACVDRLEVCAEDDSIGSPPRSPETLNMTVTVWQMSYANRKNQYPAETMNVPDGSFAYSDRLYRDLRHAGLASATSSLHGRHL
jgi:hypothetical protein